MSARLSGTHGLEEHPHRLGGQVDAVADHLEDRLPLTGRAQRGGDGTGRAVVQRRHAVEDVRHQRPAGTDPELDDAVERGPRGRGVGVGMPHSRYDPGGDQLLGELAGAGALRGEGHLDEVPAGRRRRGPRPVPGRGRRGRRGPGRRAGPPRGTVLRGGSRRASPPRRAWRAAVTPARSVRARCRHQRADEAGGPVAQVVVRGGPSRVGIRTELATGTAVTVQVDQAGHQGQAIGPVAGDVRPRLAPPGQGVEGSDPRDAVTLDHHATVGQHPGRGDHATGEQCRGVHARHHGGRAPQAGT